MTYLSVGIASASWVFLFVAVIWVVLISFSVADEERYCLKKYGKAYGIDISEGMVQRTIERLNKTSALDRVKLYRGDAAKLPFDDETFDVVLINFTLELFDNPEISAVLDEVGRVLKPGGKLGVVSLSKTNVDSPPVRIYEWIHSKWPQYFDCRPIYLDESVQKAGYKMIIRETARLLILPIEIVIAIKDI